MGTQKNVHNNKGGQEGRPTYLLALQKEKRKKKGGSTLSLS